MTDPKKLIERLREIERLTLQALSEAKPALGGPEGESILGYTIPAGTWLMLQARIRNAAEALASPSASVGVKPKRTPEQIIGHDNLMQLIFEGYEVTLALPSSGVEVVAVPREATEAMIEAFIAEGQAQGVAFDEFSPPMYPAKMYRAMIAAATTARATESGK